MSVTIVVARSLNNVIGKDDGIPWRVKGEQKLFREITMGGVLVMGRKTFESIGRPLPGRDTIIVSRTPGYSHEGCTTAATLDAALDAATKTGKDVFIVGGGEIYRQALERVDGVHISTIGQEVDGDVFFPDFPVEGFRLVREKHYRSNIDYTYQYFERVTNEQDKR